MGGGEANPAKVFLQNGLGAKDYFMLACDWGRDRVEFEGCFLTRRHGEPRRTSFRNSVSPGVTEEVDRGLADIFRASTISWRLVARLKVDIGNET